MFESCFKQSFDKFKHSFRGIVDNIRTLEYEYFLKINEAKAKKNAE